MKEIYCNLLQFDILCQSKGSVKMTTVSLRFDDEMKKQLDEMCDEMGMNLTTFFMIYAKKALRERRIPFDIAAPLEPFYSDINMKQLKKTNQQVKNGQIIVKTMEELEAMEHE